MKLILLIISFLISYPTFAKMSAEFSPNPVYQGDSVDLVISSEKPFSEMPNLDVLSQDFIVGGQQQRQSSQWINGKGSSLYQLIFTLFPNKSGDIHITGLKVGDESISLPVLTVNKDPNYKEQTGQINLQVECPQTSIYPSQKLICNVFLEDSLGLVDGEISAPQIADGTWTQILPIIPVASTSNQAKKYQTAFAFNPKKSGLYKIPPFIFKGLTRLNTRTNHSFSNIFDFVAANIPSSATKPVSAQTTPFSLKVKEKPATYKGWWLPSTQVTLEENYDAPHDIFVGDPISRTVTLTAKGVAAEDLPVPQVSQIKGLKSYTNPEIRSNLKDSGQVSVTFTFVPTIEGELLLPEIRVPWFDTTTEQIQEAIIMPRPIVVKPSTEIQTSNETNISIPSKEDIIDSKKLDEKTTTLHTFANLPWVFIGAFALIAFILGIGLSFALFRHFQRKASNSSSRSKKKKPLPDLYPF